MYTYEVANLIPVLRVCQPETIFEPAGLLKLTL